MDQPSAAMGVGNPTVTTEATGNEGYTTSAKYCLYRTVLENFAVERYLYLPICSAASKIIIISQFTALSSILYITLHTLSWHQILVHYLKVQ